MQNFEKDYRKQRDFFRGEIQKLEQKTKKTGKKVSPDQLQQQIQVPKIIPLTLVCNPNPKQLNAKVKEAQTSRQDKLKQVCQIRPDMCVTCTGRFDPKKEILRSIYQYSQGTAHTHTHTH